MESPILMLVFGIVIGVLLTVRPLTNVMYDLNERAPAAFPYIMLGVLLFGASWALNWIGFSGVITAFFLYQFFGKGKITLPSFSFPWKRRTETVEETPTAETPTAEAPTAETPEDQEDEALGITLTNGEDQTND